MDYLIIEIWALGFFTGVQNVVMVGGTRDLSTLSLSGFGLGLPELHGIVHG